MRVLLAPGSALNQKFKRWDLQNFIDLGQALEGRAISVDFVLGKEETELIEFLPNVKTHLGLTVSAMHALACEANLAVCNDSFLLHFFSLAGLKTLALYGPTDPKRTLPLNSEWIESSEALACRPCWGTDIYGRCPIEYRCLKNLSFEAVLHKCLAMIDDRK